MFEKPSLIARFEGWQKLGLNAERCPVRDVLSNLGDKWTILILLVLAIKPRRFNELAREVPDISRRMLTETLRKLEKQGLLVRSVFAASPPTVEYHLSELGCSALFPITALVEWAEQNHEQIVESRVAYEHRNSKA